LANKLTWQVLRNLPASFGNLQHTKGEDTHSEEAEIDARVFQLYGLTEQEMIDVLQSIATVSEGERQEVQSVFRRLEREKK
jgi:hypothetical protein